MHLRPVGVAFFAASVLAGCAASKPSFCEQYANARAARLVSCYSVPGDSTALDSPGYRAAQQAA
jgi:hypothetical protein